MGGGALANRFVSMAVPGANGAGPSIDVSQMVAPKTFNTKGTWLGEVVAIQGSMDGTTFDEIATFTGPDQVRRFKDTPRFVRSFMFGFNGGTPAIDLGGVEDEEWLNFVRKGQAFYAEDFVQPGAGLFGHLQLFNPAGSGIRVICRDVQHAGTATAIRNLRRHDVALATLGPPAGFVIENELGGGPAAVAEVREDALAVAVGSIFGIIAHPAFDEGSLPPSGQEWLHELLPGQGILVTGAVGLVVIVNWQWVEVPLVTP